jgi:hypothetical protein
LQDKRVPAGPAHVTHLGVTGFSGVKDGCAAASSCGCLGRPPLPDLLLVRAGCGADEAEIARRQRGWCSRCRQEATREAGEHAAAAPKHATFLCCCWHNDAR